LVRKIFTFYINYVLLFKCPVPGLKGYGMDCSTYTSQLGQIKMCHVFGTIAKRIKRVP
jgi:hypothetical protein